VLVDGLGGPWLGPAELDARQRESRRRILATPAALEMPAPGAPDPRATMVLGAADRDFAVRAAAALAAPVLVIETPSSPTPDSGELVEHFADATLLHLPSRDAVVVASAAESWWADR
jgi:hypothetical protein